jgi:hypothetical protein
MIPLEEETVCVAVDIRAADTGDIMITLLVLWKQVRSPIIVWELRNVLDPPPKRDDPEQSEDGEQSLNQKVRVPA